MKPTAWTQLNSCQWNNAGRPEQYHKELDIFNVQQNGQTHHCFHKLGADKKRTFSNNLMQEFSIEHVQEAGHEIFPKHTCCNEYTSRDGGKKFVLPLADL